MVQVRARQELHVGGRSAQLQARQPFERFDAVGFALERQQERRDLGTLLDPQRETQHHAEHALALREILERHRRVTAGAEPPGRLLPAEPELGRPIGDVDPAVVVEPHALTRRQQHVGGAHVVARAAAAVGVHADAAGREPPRQRSAEVRGIDAQRQSALGESRVNRLEPGAAADPARPRRGVDLDRVEARQVEGEATIVRDRTAHRGRARPAQGDRNPLGPGPAQRTRGFGGVDRLEDHVGHRAGQRPREQRSEVHVLITVRFGPQQRVGDDALPQRARRFASGLARQLALERPRQLARARRRVAVGDRAPVVEEEVEIRNGGANRGRAQLGREPGELVPRPGEVTFEIGRFGHPDPWGRRAPEVGCSRTASRCSRAYVWLRKPAV